MPSWRLNGKGNLLESENVQSSMVMYFCSSQILMAEPVPTLLLTKVTLVRVAPLMTSLRLMIPSGAVLPRILLFLKIVSVRVKSEKRLANRRSP